MRIAFRADGDLQKGTGHLMRCCAIAAEFRRQGDTVCFYCGADSLMGAEWLHSKQMPVKMLPACATVEQEAKVLAEALREAHADIVIIDSYWLSDKYFTIAGESGAMVAAIDDSALYNYNCDVIINGNLGGGCEDYSHCKVQKLLLGSRYSILREEFNITPIGKLNKEGRKILVTMGGADIRNYTPTVIKGLKEIPDIDAKVVYGPLMENIEEIRRAADGFSGNLEIISQPHSMAALMAECDIAISAGGGSVRELFCMGTPSLFILQAENQLPLHGFLDDVGVGDLCLGTYEHVKPKAIELATEKLLKDYSRRLSVRETFLSFDQRSGTKNIVRELKALLA